MGAVVLAGKRLLGTCTSRQTLHVLARPQYTVCVRVCVRVCVCARARERETALGHLHVTAYTSRSGETALHGLHTCVCLCVGRGNRKRLVSHDSQDSKRFVSHDSQDSTPYASFICVR